MVARIGPYKNIVGVGWRAGLTVLSLFLEDKAFGTGDASHNGHAIAKLTTENRVNHGGGGFGPSDEPDFPSGDASRADPNVVANTRPLALPTADEFNDNYACWSTDLLTGSGSMWITPAGFNRPGGWKHLFFNLAKMRETGFIFNAILFWWVNQIFAEDTGYSETGILTYARYGDRDLSNFSIDADNGALSYTGTRKLEGEQTENVLLANFVNGITANVYVKKRFVINTSTGQAIIVTENP